MGAQAGGEYDDQEIGNAVVHLANAAGAKFAELKAASKADPAAKGDATPKADAAKSDAQAKPEGQAKAAEDAKK
ncbi:MAG: hypothetical protein ACKOQV_06805 [Betaproteobacteria bacterium]|jgi:hypothetical protein